MLYRYHGRELQLLLPNGMRIATGRAHLAYGYIVFSSFVSRFFFSERSVCWSDADCYLYHTGRMRYEGC